MKNTNKRALLICLLLALSVFFAFGAACKKEESVTLELDRTEANMLYGDEITLVPTYDETAGESLVWDSSDEKVATVDGGKIAAVGCGNADISVTYRGKTAKCAVTVSFGNMRPELVLNGMPDKLRIGKGNSFVLDASVSFNGKKYDCDFTAEISDENVAEFSEGKLTGKAVGTTEVIVKSEWNSFDGALMQKTVSVEVFNDVVLNAFVTIDGEKYATDNATIYVTDEWQGEKYGTSAKIEFLVRDNGEEKVLYGELVSGENAVSCEDGVLSAIEEGKAVYSAKYRDSLGNDYSIFVNVSVVCPVVDYSERIELCADEAFPVEKYFGADAKILSAKSEGKELSVNDGVVSFTARGNDTAALEVRTSKGGYLFKDVYAYTRLINKQNFASTFMLSNNKIIDGYYILKEDIEGLEAYSQHTGNAGTYFKGTFDGEGHTVKATANANGLFGALNDGATIKNVKFEFTFSEGTAACGLAKNQGTFNNKKPVYLNNVYVVTTNYTEQACTLMDNMPDALEMYDVLVKINGNAQLGTFTDVGSLRTALFRLDQAHNDGCHGAFLGKFLNVRVITESFIPVSNGKRYNDTIFTTYAYNDEDKLGKFSREGAKGSFMYYRYFDDNEEGSDKKTLFGLNTYAYGARADFKNGGIARYDTAEELIAAGVTKVGSWTVE